MIKKGGCMKNRKLSTLAYNSRAGSCLCRVEVF